MSRREPRFEVVHTGPRKFHARYRAVNGQIVFTTESYTRRRAAQRAIWTLVSSLGCGESAGGPRWQDSAWIVNDGVAIEVRYVEEPAPKPDVVPPYTTTSGTGWIMPSDTVTTYTWNAR